MKIFHLSDLHIGLKINNKDLREDQEYILNEIVKAAEENLPDVIVIAGDVYDKSVQSGEAIKVFDKFITSLVSAVPQAVIMIISGNHDSSDRLDLFRDILKHNNIYMIGHPPTSPNDYIEKVTLKDDYGKVNFYLLPFVKPSSIRNIVGTDENGNNFSYNDSVHKLIERESIDESERNILVSHQFYIPIGTDAAKVERMDNEVCTVGNIDAINADVLQKFDYAALGHIHKPMKVGSEHYRYCGTPLACSISESGQSKGIILIELKAKGNLSTKTIPLVPLRQIRIISGNFYELLHQGSDDYVSLRLTEKVNMDSMEMQDRLRAVFPNYLEIRPAEEATLTTYSRKNIEAENLDPFSLCCEFLQDVDEEEKLLLQDVINIVKEM